MYFKINKDKLKIIIFRKNIIKLDSEITRFILSICCMNQRLFTLLIRKKICLVTFYIDFEYPFL